MGRHFLDIATRGAMLMIALALTGCGDGTSPSSVQAPGAQKRQDTAALEAGAVVLQDKPPVEALNAYLDGFHFYSGRMDAQMEAHHYCTILNEELIQCVIFDGNTRQSKLMGVEYIRERSPFQGAARRGEGALAQPCARGEIGPADRAGNSAACGARADEEARRHLRQDLSHLAHRPAQGTALGRAATHDGLHFGRPSRHGDDRGAGPALRRAQR
ncbi:hypothetical protein FHT32_003822 [Variovorax sp. SG517]|nr:hypothetical protein [Variovorax sp. SG517]